jgi:hypothetical protein
VLHVRRHAHRVFRLQRRGLDAPSRQTRTSPPRSVAGSCVSHGGNGGHPRARTGHLVRESAARCPASCRPYDVVEPPRNACRVPGASTVGGGSNRGEDAPWADDVVTGRPHPTSRSGLSRSPSRRPRRCLWALGEHRLLCGDATDPASYERLLAGQPARMLFTDHPGTSPSARTRTRGIASAAASPTTTSTPSPPSTPASRARPSRTSRVTSTSCSGPRAGRPSTGPSASRGCAGRPRPSGSRTASSSAARTTTVGMSRSGMGGRRARPRRSRAGGTSTTSGRWSPSRSPHHPTTKPPALVARAIEASSTSGERVLDPFRRLGLDAHRRRADGAARLARLAGPALLRRHRRAVGAVQRAGGGAGRRLGVRRARQVLAPAG